MQFAASCGSRLGVQDVGVDHGGADVGVAEQFLNGSYVVAGRQQMGGEGVAQRVHGNRPHDDCVPHRELKRALQRLFVHVVTPNNASTRIDRIRVGREHPEPAPRPAGIGVLPFQRMRHINAVLVRRRSRSKASRARGDSPDRSIIYLGASPASMQLVENLAPQLFNPVILNWSSDVQGAMRLTMLTGSTDLTSTQVEVWNGSNYFASNYSFSPSPVPEPSSALLFASVAPLLLWRLRSRAARPQLGAQSRSLLSLDAAR